MTDRPLWGGRFSSEPAPEARALGRSLPFDVRLAPFEIEASIAHVRALQLAGVLEPAQADALEAALREIGEEIASGRFPLEDADEDIHSAVERTVIERLGDVGARLHAGRSRNDLVATDLRLWLLAAGLRIDELVRSLIGVLTDRAREHAGTLMPGATHARNAQPVTLGHHLLAHAWALVRDRQRLGQWAERTSTSPLGAGAIATSTLGLDPGATASRLGFDRPFENSIDAVSERDAPLEFLGLVGIVAVHLGRLAADIARWTDPSLGWAELDDAYATGSSMMPNKRNPDTVELARGKAARVTSGFGRLAAVLAPLPLGYHRDLQEDKEPVFDAADTIELVLPALTGAVRTLAFRSAAMRAALSDEDLYATDLAEALVREGIPFREAHRRTGELLKEASAAGSSLAELPQERWATFGLPDGPKRLDPERSVGARDGAGGPTAASVLRQAEAIERSLASA